MNIYMAAPWEHRELVESLGERLSQMGYRVVSHWWARKETDDESILEECAEQDLDELRTADILLVLNTNQSEGKAFEQGYAHALGLPVLVIGPYLNIFQRLLFHVNSFEEAIDFIGHKLEPW